MAVVYLSVSSGSGSGTYPSGSYANIGANSRTGYSFKQWTWSSCLMTDQYNPNTSVYLNQIYGLNASAGATYTINQYTIDYYAGTGGYISGNAHQIGDYGTGATSVTALANEGYHFTQWSDGKLTAARTTDSFGSYNKSFTAYFEADPPTIGYYGFGTASYALLSTLSTMSVCAWVWTDTWGDADISRIINNYLYTNGSGWQLGLSDATPVKAITFGAGWSGGWASWYANNAFDLSTWYHICITYDRTSTSNDPIIYSDGISESVTESVAPSGSIVADSTNILTIGRMTTAASTYEYLEGFIRDIRIYNRILSPAEVLEIYESRCMTNNINGLVFAPVMYGAKGLSTFDGQTLVTGNTILDPYSKNVGTPAGAAVGEAERLLHKGT